MYDELTRLTLKARRTATIQGITVVLLCVTGLLHVGLFMASIRTPHAMPPKCKCEPPAVMGTYHDGVDVPSGAFVVEGAPTAGDLERMDASLTPDP